MDQTLHFYKYQGTGNDFVMVDNRKKIFPGNRGTVARLCDRRFGIGGDGLILLENDPAADFRMVYYNLDGNESTMCGNGGRCIVAFAHFLGIFTDRCTFNAIDGTHEATISGDVVKLKMIDVNEVSTFETDFVLNTGSPHYVRYVDGLEQLDVYNEGRGIRNCDAFRTEGINVNFVEKTDSGLFVRTYERGVEDETFSCGTGVTAAALTYLNENPGPSVPVRVLGGQLKIYAEKKGSGFKNIWLEGPAEQVFKGDIQL